MRFSYYKTANRTAPCGVVRCGAILLALRCSYAILRAVLVRFLRFVQFMQFDEHLYIYIYIYIEHSHQRMQIVYHLTSQNPTLSILTYHFTINPI